MKALNKVALIDDDLKPVRLLDLDDTTRDALNDDTSDEYEFVFNFANKYYLFPKDLDTNNVNVQQTAHTEFLFLF